MIENTSRTLTEAEAIQLSICIATYNRGNFISETLDCILAQVEPGVEIVVVDGASPDNTPEVMAQYVSNHPEIKYYREKENSGVDADFDKAVGYANGQYCWLMTDDDLLRSGSIKRVLSSINDDVDLVIVDAEIWNADMSIKLEESRLNFDMDRMYKKGDEERFFVDVGNYLSFIGCVIIRRDFWLTRNRSLYFGTVFIHVGVIFQHPPPGVIRVISEPLVLIRYGNAMWTPRSFDIWMFKWPKIIWSFPDYSDKSKKSICLLEPWRKVKSVFHFRAKGAYSINEFKKYFLEEKSIFMKFVLFIIAVFPSKLANFLSAVYVLKNKNYRLSTYELSLSPNASALSLFLSRKFRK